MNDILQRYTEQLPALLIAWGGNLAGALITLVVGFTIAGWAGRLVRKALGRSDKIDPVFHPLAGKIVRLVIMAFTVIAVLGRFGVETASLIAAVGAAGLAIGLALQGTLSNVAAGVMILLLRPFKIGDAVNIGGSVYVIDSIGFFACRAHLPDGPKAFIPNAEIWGKTLVNLSETDQDLRRIDQTYGIAYGDDIDTAIAILQRVVAADPRVRTEPAPLIKVQALADSSVNILLRVWTARTDWWDTQLDLMKDAKQQLEAGGITIPFPQRELHVIQAAAPRA
ncbi:mechanosensitive ion channel family protein [Rubrivivax albus]|uniref:Small-conductance mechanosensitive channel n=1 Tax=Rubrivivax albus TaxID=2499835 RepID=A0A3S2US24_9BURK|nr:mechanosensitive ion channel domain-containing protein [Rubrivivax albus]RVT53756.1 mechanosensitive ion channel [Rubrivivax albus]